MDEIETIIYSDTDEDNKTIVYEHIREYYYKIECSHCHKYFLFKYGKYTNTFMKLICSICLREFVFFFGCSHHFKKACNAPFVDVVIRK